MGANGVYDSLTYWTVVRNRQVERNDDINSLKLKKTNLLSITLISLFLSHTHIHTEYILVFIFSFDPHMSCPQMSQTPKPDTT